ncbi:MAG: type II toxin-antitoxin system PemK/MazF family toxin [Chloroflexota bacterium]|nr:type II toxin-antitoxin system PemK/MazF family toxin [Chloroflexota bacterium]
MIIHQGDIYWVQVNELDLETHIAHPHVVLQPTVLNQSRIATLVVCALTTNVRRAHLPGNVLLEVGEANLPRQSIVEVSKVSAVAKAELGEYIGTLSAERLAQIFAGMAFVQETFIRQDM